MINSHDEAERLRHDADHDRHARARAAESPNANPSAILATTGGSPYPTKSGVYFTMTAKAIYGATTVGTTPPSVTIGGTFQAAGFGNLPPVGTTVICRWVNSRWVFQA